MQNDAVMKATLYRIMAMRTRMATTFDGVAVRCCRRPMGSPSDVAAAWTAFEKDKTDIVGRTLKNRVTWATEDSGEVINPPAPPASR